MIDDLSKSIRAALYDRTTSPLFGALTISFIVWNHRLLVVLFSGMTVEQKFSYIDEVLYATVLAKTILLAIGPLITAIFFLYVYPHPAKWVYQYWRARQKELKDIRRKIEDETPLTIEQSRRIRRQITDVQADYEEELQRQTTQVAQLKDLLAERSTEIDELKEVLEASSAAGSAGPVEPHAVPDDELRRALLRHSYRLFFNPKRGWRQSKTMTFGPPNRIYEGMNQNEAKWEVQDGKLELYNED